MKIVKILLAIIVSVSCALSANEVFSYVKTSKGTFASWNAYLAAKADSVKTLQIGQNWTVAGKNTNPATIDLNNFVGTARFYGSTGSATDTLVISKMSARPMHQIFDTSLTVIFAVGAAGDVKPEWFGPKTSKSINRAVSS